MSEADIAAAVRERDAARVRVLAEGDPEAAGGRDEHGESLLLLALFHGLPEAAAALRAARRTPLDALEAAALGDAQRLAALLDADAAAVLAARTTEGFDPLGLAAFLGGAPVVALLLERGADPDGDPANRLGVRPVHAAAAHRDAAALERLLAAGADPDARQPGGVGALHAAALHDDLDSARVLLSGGADPAVRDDAGRTPADLAGSERMRALLAP